MKQSKFESFIEAALNISSGFILSYLTWVYVVPPVFGIETEPSTSLSITLLFTAVSLVRSYVWRRLFNNGAYHTTKQLIRRFA